MAEFVSTGQGMKLVTLRAFLLQRVHLLLKILGILIMTPLQEALLAIESQLVVELWIWVPFHL